MHERQRQTGQTDRQRPDSIGRSFLQTVAQKRLNGSGCRLGRGPGRHKEECIRWVHSGATWRIPLHRPCATAMRSFCQLTVKIRNLLPLGFGGAICVTMPNFVPISETVAEMLRLLIFQNGGRPPSWICFVCLDHPRRELGELYHCANLQNVVVIVQYFQY